MVSILGKVELSFITRSHDYRLDVKERTYLKEKEKN